MSSLQSYVSLLCMIITGFLSAWGIFSQHYDDTLLQRMGLSIVAIGCFTRVYERILYDIPAPTPALLWSQVGLSLFAIGTAWRVRQNGRGYTERRRGHGRRGDAY